MLMLPSDFRAGSESAHGHSLIHLWADAADGHIAHQHQGLHAFAGHQPLVDWLDPVVEDATPDLADASAPDVGDHDDSTSPASGVHLLLAAISIVPPISAPRMHAIAVSRRPCGVAPRVLLPPPRSLLVTT